MEILEKLDFKKLKKNLWAKYQDQDVHYMVTLTLNGKILIKDKTNTVVHNPKNEKDLESYLISIFRIDSINKIISE